MDGRTGRRIERRTDNGGRAGPGRLVAVTRAAPAGAGVLPGSAGSTAPTGTASTGRSPRSVRERIRHRARAHRFRVRHGMRGHRAQLGMSTAEYAVGTIAACAFAAVLYKIVTSGAVGDALRRLIEKALGAAG